LIDTEYKGLVVLLLYLTLQKALSEEQ